MDLKIQPAQFILYIKRRENSPKKMTGLDQKKLPNSEISWCSKKTNEIGKHSWSMVPSSLIPLVSPITTAQARPAESGFTSWTVYSTLGAQDFYYVIPATRLKLRYWHLHYMFCILLFYGLTNFLLWGKTYS